MERIRPDQTADERSMLTAMLDAQRATVVAKATGVGDADARRAVAAPSNMTVMGLVKHLTAVERWWFSVDFAGLAVEPPWPDGEPFDGFELSDDDTMASVLAAYAAEVEASRAVVVAASFDDLAAAPPDDPFTLRYAVAHMIEETARHCGHLDLMREAIDGARGE